MKAKCIRQTWTGERMYHVGQVVDIDPEDSWAVHFKFEENPHVRHDYYDFNEKIMEYVKIGQKAVPQKVNVPVNKPEGFRDLAAEANMELLNQGAHDPIGIEIEGGEEVYTDIPSEPVAAKRGRPFKS